jgi:predicted component of type VI protein secretion system
MFRADGERRSFSVMRDLTVIGRREDCDLRIPLGDVSRKHCRLIRENNSLRLEDLGSSNGTFHNGKRVQETAVQAGDTIQVGPVVFLVQIDGLPADEHIQGSGLQAGAEAPSSPMEGGGIPTEYTPPSAQEGDGFIVMDSAASGAPVEDVEIEFIEDSSPEDLSKS